ncbi:Rho-binding antiterminator [Vibrio sp. E150_011]
MLSCAHYDQIELLCLYRFPIRIALNIQTQNSSHFNSNEPSKDVIEGIAIDTQRNERKEECLRLQCDQEMRLIVLTDIKTIDVLIDNPHVMTVVMT